MILCGCQEKQLILMKLERKKTAYFQEKYFKKMQEYIQEQNLKKKKLQKLKHLAKKVAKHSSTTKILGHKNF